MRLTSLEDARRLAQERKITIATIGDTPFFVGGLEDILPIRFVSLLRKSDGEFPGFETIFAGDIPDGRPGGDRLTIDDCLANPRIQPWLRSPEVSGVLVWDHSVASESICDQVGITLLAAPRRVSLSVENKIELPEILRSLDLPTLPHMVVSPSAPRTWDEISSCLGSPVVIQAADNNLNGRSTYRVASAAEFEDVMRHHHDESVKVCSFAAGSSFNLNGLVLPDQFVPGIGSTQLVGIPELIGIPFGYCGNETPLARWYSDKTLEMGWDAMERLSEFLRCRGYTGLVGVDFVVDHDGIPYMVDINPRMQSSQALITATHISNGLPPLALLHIFHYLGIDVSVDTDRYWDVARGKSSPLSQVVIFHKGESSVASGDLRPGRINLLSSELEDAGTSLIRIEGSATGVLHRACERGRKLPFNATMLAVQVKRSVLKDRNELQPWVVDLVSTLRHRAIDPLRGSEQISGAN